MNNKTHGSSTTTRDGVGADDPDLIQKTIPLGDAKDDKAARLLVLGGIGELAVLALPPGSIVSECVEFFGRVFLRGKGRNRHAVVQAKIVKSDRLDIKVSPEE